MSGKGNSITLNAKRKWLFRSNTILTLEKKRYSHNKDLSLKSSVSRTALATHFSEISVKRIMAEYNKGRELSEPTPTGSNPLAKR